MVEVSKIAELLDGPQINTCDECEEVAQALADFLREVIAKRNMQARLAIYTVKMFAELAGYDWLTMQPNQRITLPMIRAMENLITQFEDRSRG